MDDDLPLKHGWLNKQGRHGIVRNWKKRYVVLEAGKLSYYTDALESYPYGEHMKGSLELVNTELVSDLTKMNEKQIYVETYSGEKSLLLECETIEEAKIWRQILLVHINYSNKVATIDQRIHSDESSPQSKAMDMGEIYGSDIQDEDTVHTPPTPPVVLPPPKRASMFSRRVEPTPSSSPPSSTSSSTRSSSLSFSTRPIPSVPAVVEEELESEESSELTRISEFSEYILSYVVLLKGDQRQQALNDLKNGMITAASSLASNTQEGEIGKRDEKLLVAPFVVASLVLFTKGGYLRQWISFFCWLSGIPLILLGIAVMLHAFYELREKNSLLVIPSKDHTLTTTGLFSLVRHPTYAGLVILCIGIALYRLNAVNLVLSAFLAILLDYVASAEEKHLLNAYPTAYKKYSTGKRRFIPYVY